MDEKDREDIEAGFDPASDLLSRAGGAFAERFEQGRFSKARLSELAPELMGKFAGLGPEGKLKFMRRLDEGYPGLTIYVVMECRAARAEGWASGFIFWIATLPQEKIEEAVSPSRRRLVSELLKDERSMAKRTLELGGGAEEGERLFALYSKVGAERFEAEWEYGELMGSVAASGKVSERTL